jgi:hypothetical protein
LFEDAGALHIRVYDPPDKTASATLFLELPNGNASLLAVMPGFVGTVVVESGCIVNVTYLPSVQGQSRSGHDANDTSISNLRAYAAVAARNASYRLNKQPFDQRLLKTTQAIDLTLGLYSVYAYMQAGDNKAIWDLHSGIRASYPLMFFDIALLARITNPELFDEHPHPITPCCPMLTQGWAFIEQEDTMLPSPVRKAGRHLIPGLWTMFDSEGVDILWSAISRGELP